MTRRTVAGLLLLAPPLLLAAAGPPLSPWPWDEIDFAAFGEGPTRRHWFGTTQNGRDVFAVTVHALRRSLLIGFAVAVLATCLAALVGVAAGFAGGRADRALMWGVDLLVVLPPFLVVAVLAPRTGGALALVAVLAALLWTTTARMVRAMTRTLREREYVRAARLAGVSVPRTIVRHVLPQLASLLAVDAGLNVGAAIVAESGLAHLGFGARPPDVSLGTLIADGGTAVLAYPWRFVLPAALLAVLVVAVNLLADGLRDTFDPAAR
ncbi:ABC transporter permease [Actinomadura algeriensis]|uniref:ABC-type dipeptide/oligopeptide/nickel transport system permease subunit n=1 Tax=Actinomadura algeriensis TaxID=1679523 RepID=A0ABR9JWK4_9ACTN|nr:ABC transporter permease [Actinomadura algeriensis]MBE1534953.1 ABC-type dipeptide/oligopeptide/nickel transport system permease subunit [Actinomadura algeriensis]